MAFSDYNDDDLAVRFPIASRTAGRWAQMSEQQRARAIGRMPTEEYEFFQHTMARQAEETARSEAGERALEVKAEPSVSDRLNLAMSNMSEPEIGRLKSQMGMPAFDLAKWLEQRGA